MMRNHKQILCSIGLLSPILSNKFTCYKKCHDESLNSAAPTDRGWDDNWDNRNTNNNLTENNRFSHRIIMVRHGQYDESGKEDETQKLTDLGREQARLTGIRIQELLLSPQYKKYPLREVYYSTMTRATETWSLISESLSLESIQIVKACDLIREGAVCKPVPSHSTWNPSEEQVSNDFHINHFFLLFFFCIYFFLW